MNFLIVFSNPTGAECERFTGTEQEAIKYATGDRRHLNYGRNGVAIYGVTTPCFTANRDGFGLLNLDEGPSAIINGIYQAEAPLI